MKVRYFCRNTNKLKSHEQFCKQSLKLVSYTIKNIKRTNNEKYDSLYKELNVKENNFMDKNHQSYQLFFKKKTVIELEEFLLISFVGIIANILRNFKTSLVSIL